jgi:hypothetical protein
LQRLPALFVLRFGGSLVGGLKFGGRGPAFRKAFCHFQGGFDGLVLRFAGKQHTPTAGPDGRLT